VLLLFLLPIIAVPPATQLLMAPLLLAVLLLLAVVLVLVEGTVSSSPSPLASFTCS
jgi:hypothetical protein